VRQQSFSTLENSSSRVSEAETKATTAGEQESIHSTSII
jgi:stress response protein SCP2